MKLSKKIGLLPALVMGLAACGGGSDSGTGPTEPSTPQAVVLQGEITSDTTLTANNQYLLRGAVFVRAGATLTIQAGTTIFGERSSTGTLIVDRGGRLQANGTASAPIVLTSDQPVGSRARGDWGGLIINGFGVINVPGGTAEGEGDTGVYGGSDPGDSSGNLTFLRVEFAGIEFSPDNELNGIAFQGVGANTGCDNLQVHFNKDDGFEFFGGQISCKHLVSTGIGDDSFDWTEGFSGRGQFWVAQQRGDDADQGFESDSSGENNELEPRANPTIYNVTLLGAPGSGDGNESDIGMLLREGTAGRFFNFIVMGFKEEGVVIDGASSQAQAGAGALFLSNSIVHGNGEGNFDGTTAGFALGWTAISDANPMLGDPFNNAAPNFAPQSGSPATDGSIPVAVPPSDGFFEAVTYIGAVDPASDFTQGWTTSAQN